MQHLNSFLDFIRKNPKIYFYEKAIKQVLKHIREHYNLKASDLEAISFFEVHRIDFNNIEKKLEFVLRINYGFEKSIDFNLYTFILNDKMYFLSVYGDKDDANFDLYN